MFPVSFFLALASHLISFIHSYYSHNKKAGCKVVFFLVFVCVSIQLELMWLYHRRRSEFRKESYTNDANSCLFLSLSHFYVSSSSSSSSDTLPARLFSKFNMDGIGKTKKNALAAYRLKF